MPLLDDDIRRAYDEVLLSESASLLILRQARQRVGELLIEDMFADLTPREREGLKHADALNAYTSVFRAYPANAHLLITTPEDERMLTELVDQLGATLQWLADNWKTFSGISDDARQSGPKRLRKSVAGVKRWQADIAKSLASDQKVIFKLEMLEVFIKTPPSVFHFVVGVERTTEFGHALTAACQCLTEYHRVMRSASQPPNSDDAPDS